MKINHKERNRFSLSAKKSNIVWFQPLKCEGCFFFVISDSKERVFGFWTVVSASLWQVFQEEEEGAARRFVAYCFFIATQTIQLKIFAKFQSKLSNICSVQLLKSIKREDEGQINH